MAAAPCNADLLRVSSTSACSISAACFRTRTSRLLAFCRRKFARPPPSWVLSRLRQVILQAPGRSWTTSRHLRRRQSSRTLVSSRRADRIGVSARRSVSAGLTTPSAALSVASQLLVDAAATPPLRGGELRLISNSFSRGAFFGELLLVCRLQVRDLRSVRSEIAKARRIVRIAWFIDLVQVELARMRRHPDFGLVGRLHGESVLEVLNDGRIAGRAQELHAGIDAVHIYDENVVLSAAILNGEAEAVGAGRVPVSLEHRHVGVAELDMVARLGLHIHLDRIVDDAARPAVIEIAARFQHARIAFVDIR